MSNKKRLQLDFSKEAVERLDLLKESTGVSSRADVFRNALKLYDTYVEKKKEGYSCRMVKDDDNIIEIII